jgi:hypothetical protein
MDLRMGIDSGPITSGVTIVAWSDSPEERRVVFSHNTYENASLLGAFENQSMILPDLLGADTASFDAFPCISVVSIEKIVPYGRSVGQETFDASWMGGEFALAGRWRGKRVIPISRPNVKLVLFGSLTYSDASGKNGRKGVDTKLLKECIKPNFSPYGGGNDPYKGVKSKKGPLYLVSGEHAWDALAVAVAGPML